MSKREAILNALKECDLSISRLAAKCGYRWSVHLYQIIDDDWCSTLRELKREGLVSVRLSPAGWVHYITDDGMAAITNLK